MKFSNWLRNWRPNRRRPQRMDPRRLQRCVERLEPRLVLTASPSGEWFSVVHPAELSGGTLQGASGVSGTVSGDAIVGTWIVQLTRESLANVQNPSEVESLLDGFGADFQVLHGLGLPGQVLVQASLDTRDLAESALQHNSQVFAFEADTYIIGPQEMPAQLLPNDANFGELAGLDNRGQTGGAADADIDAPEAWNFVDSKLAPETTRTQVGSRTIVAGVIDSGIDYRHPDLFQNIWINPGEIPASIRAALVDTDGDHLISFVDLNATANASLVTDTVNDGNTFIDAGDLLNDPRWANRDANGLPIDDDHNGFANDLIGWDFSQVPENTSPNQLAPGDNDPLDEHRHGTHVSGILGASGNNNLGVTGINWTVSLLPLRFLGADNKGSTSNAIRAINYATMMRHTYEASFTDQAIVDGSVGANIVVTNNSWGGSTSGGALLREAIAAQGAEDILFVAAAGNGNALGQGNDNDLRPFFPSSFDLENVISVAAVDAADELVPFSNFGVRSVDLAAPGLAILSTVPNGQFRRLNGTSMAAPMVSGVATLIAAINPDATAAEIRDAILRSVDAVPSLAQRLSTGGRLNAFKAVAIDTVHPHVKDAADTTDPTTPKLRPLVTDIDFGAIRQEFSVTYGDNVAIDVVSIDAADVLVTRVETAEHFPVTLLFVQPGGNAPERFVRYAFTPPGGSWDVSDNGTYRIDLVDHQVRDSSGNFANGQTLGTFRASLSRVGQINVDDSTVDSVDANPGDGMAEDAQNRHTLRAAILEANADFGENTIVLSAGVFRLTIEGTGEDSAETGDLDIDGALTIIGSTDGHTIIDAADLDRIFDVLPGARLTLRNITLQGGLAPLDDPQGGGIRNAGTLTLENCTLRDNEAAEDGGAIANLPHANATLTNVTLSGNTAQRGAGIANSGSLLLFSTTIAANTATSTAGGIINLAGGTTRAKNTLIATNTADIGPDLNGAFASDGNNFIGNPSSSTGFNRDVAGNKVGTPEQPLDPNLAPLADNEGPTPTHELRPGSLAIDAGNNSGAPLTDQRGLIRRVNNTGTVDIGAFEQLFAEIRGKKFHDENANGVQDANEAGLPGFVIYLDLNHNQLRDSDEPSRVTAADGSYVFNRLQPGAYTVLEEPRDGFELTTPRQLEFTSSTLTTGDAPVSIVAIDLNGDSRPDLAVANRLAHNVQIFLNTGRGTFLAPQTIALPNNAAPVAITAGDFTGDGLVDLLVATQGDNKLTLLRNAVESPFTMTTTFALSAAPTSLTAGRIDVDTKLDVIVTFGDTDSAQVLKNDFLSDGTGNFTMIATLATGDDPRAATLADFDNDHDLDLVIANRGSDTLTFFANTNGTFNLGTTINAGGRNPQSLAAADFDLDGDIDLVVANNGSSSGTSIALHLNRGNATFASPVTFAGGSTPVAVQAADLDSDGALDLAVLNQSTNAISILLNTSDTSAGTTNGLSGPATLHSDGTVNSAKSVKIASGTNGPTLVDVDRFGISVASLGDLDGDGVTDLAVGSERDDTGGTDRGAVRVLLLNANGTVKNISKIASGTSGGPTLTDGDRFGISVTSLGDLDGDGVIDLAVGADRDDTGGTNRGAVHVLLRNANGTLKSSVKIASGTTGGPTLLNGDSFGFSVASLGDLDGDGVIDLAVGAYRDDTGGAERGAVYVLFMNSNGTVKSNVKIASGTNGGPTLANGDQFGFSVAPLSDLDGDGVTDLAVGAFGDDTNGSYRGAVHVLLLNANGTVKSSVKIASNTNGGPTLVNYDCFGTSVASLGDLDGDGVTDLAVGAYGDNTGGGDRGAVYVLRLNASGTVKSSLKLANDTNGVPTLANGDSFGRSVASLGDLDGDGATDLAVGAVFDNTGGSQRGAVHLLFLNAVLTDLGDAPDTSSGTGAGNYQTLLTNGGPSHLINTTQTTLFLGARVDSEANATQSARANGDDITTLPDDEDGLIEPAQDLLLTVGTAPTVRVRATNTTGSAAMLFGWIDFNRDGVFDNATERTSVTVPTATNNGTFTLTFPAIPNGTAAGTTYARFRLSTDVAAANSTGSATGGEVEDYTATITQRSDGTVKSAKTVKIASDTNGGPALTNGDNFGSSVAAIGDLDGDGVTDLAVGAVGDDTEGTDRGALYIQFMNSNGTVKSSVKLASRTNGFLQLYGNSDRMGSAVASLGDLDGDGVTDLAVGIPGGDMVNGTDSGYVYVLFMNSNGTVKSTTELRRASNGVPTLADGDRFGSSVASVGDLDGDGVSDLAVGAPGDNTGGDNDLGALYVLLLNSDGTVKSSVKIASGLNGGPTLSSSDYFSNSVASLGDLDGDGVTDLAVGAIGDDNSGTNSGAVHVLFLNSNGTVKGHVKIASEMNGGPALAGFDNFGSSVASLGDLDGDGVTELSVGATYDDASGANRGSIYVLRLNANGTAKSSVKIASGLNGGPTLEDGGLFGNSVASLGDLDGDGATDLAVGAFRMDTNGVDRGAVHVLFLRRQFGTLGPDTITGTAGADDFSGDDGDDLLTGLAGNDSLQGDNGNDQLAGGLGNDLQSGGNGNDVLQDGIGNDTLLGNAGNDVIIVSGSIATLVIDGGLGTDTLSLSGAGTVIDLTTLSDASLQGIEQIDITGSGNNTLTLNLQEVLNLSNESDTLLVRRDFGDTVNMGSGWTRGATETIGTETFAVYTQGAATLKIQNPSALELSTLNGITGTTIFGVDAGDASGRAVHRIGDINGDGFDDLLIGAYASSGMGNTTPNAGECYVVFGKGDWSASPSLDLATLNGTNGFTLFGVDVDDKDGRAVGSAGDVNGDGFDDLLIGAPRGDAAANGKFDAGESYVVFGKADWSASPTVNLATLNGTSGFTLFGVDGGDVSGVALSGAGDVNGDGFDDLLIGAYVSSGAGNATSRAGESYVVFGKANWSASPTLDLATLNGTNGFTLFGIDVLDESGRAVSVAGDVNGDGFDDLLIGAYAADAAGNAKPDAGESYVVFGKADWSATPTLNLSALNGINGFTLFGVDGGDWSAFAVSDAGDVNRDGFEDLLIGAFRGDGTANNKLNAGESYVVFGKADWSATAALDLSTLNGINGFTIVGVDTGDGSGVTVSGAGDVNGDGFDDLLIGTYRGAAAGNAKLNAGESYVVFGKADWSANPTLDLSTLNGINGFTLFGVDAGDASGNAVSGAGDVNGDGFDDLLIGAVSGDAAENTKMGAGESYLIFGGDFTSSVTHAGTSLSETLTGTSAANVMIGGRGNDTLIGNGGADVLRGGQGNDTFQISNLTFQSIDGGTGSDTLRLDGSGLTLNLTALADKRLQSIEQIDITGSGNNTLTLTKLEVLNLSGESNTLLVQGNAGDVVNIGRGWTEGANETIDGTIFRVLTQQAATLKVAAAITQKGITIDLASLGIFGTTIFGVDPIDNSGHSVSDAGDVNGDGFDDLLIGAFEADPLGNTRNFTGESYVIFGGASLPATIDLANLGTAGITIRGEERNDGSGYSVSSAGDVNGDGFDDLIIGAYGAPPAGNPKPHAGKTYVIFGSASLSATINLANLGSSGITIFGADTFDRSGCSVSSAGDVNGDGFDDLLIGADYARAAGNAKKAAGESYVIFGAASLPTTIDLANLGSTGITIFGAEEFDRNAFSVSSAGDVNGDGFDDLVIGARRAERFHNVGGRYDDKGVCYVIFGGTSLPATIDLKTLAAAGVTIFGADQGDMTSAVSGAGDVNGDGFDDLLFGAVNAAKSYVVFGGSSLPATIDLGELGAAGVRFVGAIGHSVSSAGDINADGYSDLLIGDGGVRSFVIFGRPSLSATIDLNNLGSEGIVVFAADAEDSIGDSVSNAGDVNGDGFDDLLIGAPHADAFGDLKLDAGESYLIFGSDFTLAATHQGTAAAETLTGNAAANVMIGGRGNDTLIGNGGADVLRGGQGNDTFQISDFTFQMIVGGTGRDTLRLDGSGLTLNLTTLADNRLQGIEQIDITGSGNNTLTLTKLEVLNLSDESNTLLVQGNAGDVVNIGRGWTEGANETIDGTIFRVVTQKTATLKVAAAVSLQGITIDLASLGAAGVSIFGADAGDASGRSVSDAGDVNGDGFDDLLIGAPNADGSGNTKSYAGESYVVFGAASLPATIDLANLGSAGFTIFGADAGSESGISAGDHSGISVSSAGDINGDGFDDLLIGAHYADGSLNGKSSAGESYVIFGAATLPATINLASLGSAGITIFGADALDVSGQSVSGAGDVNGDGFDDLIIGAYRSRGTNNNEDQAGESYVIFGGTSLPATIDLANLGSVGITIYGADLGDYSGRAVSSAGDVNGDGFGDLFIGADRADAAGNQKPQAGDAYVIFGGPSLPATVDLAGLGSAGITIFGADTDDHLGESLSAGDLNGDGFDDLLIGATQADAAGNAKVTTGDSYVIFGGPSLPSTIDLANVGSAGITLFGADNFDDFGRSVSSAGDVNGDGFDDLLIGARGAYGLNNAKPYAGESYLIFGGPTLPTTIDMASPGSAAITIFGADSLDRSGSVSSGGDVNGDGFDDLFIGSPGGDGAGNAKNGAGESAVIFGGDFTLAVTHQGTAASETLTGNAAANVMIGGRGNDTLIGAGGADVLIGGSGNDLFSVSDLTFQRIAGGTGSDTLQLNGSGFLLNLTTLPDSRLLGIEQIDLQGSGANRLTLNRREVLNLSDSSNTLTVTANADDTLVIGGGWTEQANQQIDGATYRAFTNGAATLKVSAAATVERLQITVNSTLDSIDANPGDGDAVDSQGRATLRAAIMEANASQGADTIYLTAGTHTLSLAGVSEDNTATGDLDIKDDLTIIGAGATTTFIDAADLDRVFDVKSGKKLRLEGVTVRNGFLTGGADGGAILNAGTLELVGVTLSGNDVTGSVTAQGGAIYNLGTGTVSLLNSVLDNNTSQGAGGGIFNLTGGSVTITGGTLNNNRSTSRSGGGIDNEDNATLSISGSTLTNNAASNNGGAINNFGGTVTISATLIDNNSVSAGTSGGGLANQGDGVMTVSSTTITRNSGQGAGAIYNVNTAQLTITGSTVANNSASSTIVTNANSAVMTISNSTFSGNVSSSNSTYGMIQNFDTATLLLTNNTITGSTVVTTTDAGGVFVSGGTVTLRNNVIAGTVSNRQDVFGAFVSQGGNFIGNVGTVTSITQSTDRTGTSGSPLNALLGPLVNYGGPARTGTLQSTIASGSTQLTLSSAINFPNLPSFTIKIDSEQLLVTAVSGTTFTVTRGVNGTTAATHNANATVTLLSIPNITTPAFHSPLAGSPLIDAGVSGANGTTDQRGAGRTLDANGDGIATTDIGAVEFAFVVTTTADTVDANPGDGIAADASGQTSLRAAIMEANALAGYDVIFIPSGIYTLTRTGTGEDAAVTGDLDLTGSLTIVGAGSGATIVDANGLDRVFQVASGATVQLSDLTVKGGSASGSGLGGGLLMQGSDLHLTRVIVANNNAGDSGGGLYVQAGTAEIEDSTFRANQALKGGAIRNATGTTVTINRSTIDTNSAVNFGGGLYVDGSMTISNSLFTSNGVSQDTGGGVFNNGSTTILGSTFQGNFCDIGSGGAIENIGQLTLTSSALIGNHTGNTGGAIRNSGAATVTNSTISGNSVSNDAGAGIVNRESGTLTMRLSTVTNNTGRNAAGIDNFAGGTFTIQNSIVVGNNPNGGDAHGAFLSLGHNLIGNGDNATGLVQGVNGDLVGTAGIPIDAKLGPLADNGGGTQTHALLATSPAIDAGQSDGVTFTDQRGLPRSLDGNDDGIPHPDIGAFERFVGFLVNSTLDTVDATPGDGIAADSMGRTTLRAAIMEANAHLGRDAIVLPAGTYTLTRTGTGEDAAGTGDLDITGDLSITGISVATTIIDAADIDRIFDVRTGATLRLENLKLKDGFAQDAEVGAGVRNEGTLFVAGTMFEGGVARHGAAIYTDGAVDVRDSTFLGNQAGNDGGAIHVAQFGAATVTNSTFTSNGAGAEGGAIFNNSSSLTVASSTFTNNGASGSGGAILNHGQLFVTSSTFTANTGVHGGAIANSFTPSGFLNVQASLFVDNSTSGGNGGAINDGPDAVLSVTN